MESKGERNLGARESTAPSSSLLLCSKGIRLVVGTTADLMHVTQNQCGPVVPRQKLRDTGQYDQNYGGKDEET
jgi:hypothetical protein